MKKLTRHWIREGDEVQIPKEDIIFIKQVDTRDKLSNGYPTLEIWVLE